MVLGLARATSPDGPHASTLTRWGNVAHTWAALSPRQARLMKRWARQCCREHGCEGRVWTGKRWALRCLGHCKPYQLRGQYCAVVEQHKPHGPDGERWPHLNLVLHWPWLARRVSRAPTRLIPRGGTRPPGRVLGRCRLLDDIVAAGWGYQACAELVLDGRAIAGYLVKHARACERTAGEVSKLSQIPYAAPQGFRRIRSGRGFLPPRLKSDATGVLVRRDEHGNWFAVSRPREDCRTWVAYGRPTFRPAEPTLWLDMNGRRVYPPEWSGWADLPCPASQRELDEWLLVLRVQDVGERKMEARIEGCPRVHSTA